MPTKLIEILKFLNSITVDVCEEHEDGRVNSITDEDTIIDKLIEKYGKENIVKPKARCWWDVKIFGYYFNIKSSKYGDASDNFSSKGAILYALTDLPIEEVDKMNNCRWKKFQDKLLKHSGKENNRDYYIFSLNKVTNEVHLTSLKSLNKLTTNGSNLPFQIKWANNTERVERTYRQAYDFLVGSYKESVRKKITAHDGFEQL